MRIKYIGEKPHGRADTVADTGIVWAAPGDVQDVPEAAVPKLLRHPDIWQVAETVSVAEPTKAVETKAYADGTVATGTAPLPDKSPAKQAKAEKLETKVAKAPKQAKAAKLAKEQPPAPPQFVIEPTEGGEPIVLDAMDVEKLTEFAKANGLDAVLVKEGVLLVDDELRAAIYEAATAE